MSRRRGWGQGSGLTLVLALALVSRPLLARADGPAPAPDPGSLLSDPAAAALPRVAQPQEVWDPALLRRAGLDPAALHCNQQVAWIDDLAQQSQAVADQILAALPPGSSLSVEAKTSTRAAIGEIVYWRLVRNLMIEGENHNAGVIPLKGYRWRDAAGVSHPVLVFRSAIVNIGGRAPSCSQSLLQSGAVRHVVNLYDADKIPIGPIIDREQALAQSCGASYLAPEQAERRYGSWRNQLRKAPAGSADQRQALLSLARLIREQILAPGGRPPQGNIYLHCGGGMHRSGMVMGILDRCVNGESMAMVAKRYRFHTAWLSPDAPGGAEAGNLSTIATFDCRSLQLPVGAV